MPPQRAPILSIGYEFEAWIPCLFNDLKDEYHPLQNDGREFFPTGTVSTNGEPRTQEPWKYDEDNAAEPDWMPNTGRVPTQESENGMLDALRKLFRNVLASKGPDLVSDLNMERVDLGPLKQGVNELYQQYTVYADRGLVADKEPSAYRRDSQVYVGYYYFNAVEVRTPAFSKANKGNHQTMCGQIESILTALTRTYPVSINAGADVWYKPPAKRKSTAKALRAESRCGTHIHVGAEGVLEYLEAPEDPESPSPAFQAALSMTMSKRIFAAKKILTLYWLIEPEIQQLHASWRSKDMRYSGLLREHTNLAYYFSLKKDEEKPLHPYHKYEEEKNLAANHYDKAKFDKELEGISKTHQIPASELEQHEKLAARVLNKLTKTKSGTAGDREAIATIWKARSMDQLAWLCSNHFGNRRGSLCLHQLLPWNSDFAGGAVREPKRRIGTVEYRYMQASLDPEAVLAWADVVIKMTEPCVTGGHGRLRRVPPPGRGAPGRAWRPQGVRQEAGLGREQPPVPVLQREHPAQIRRGGQSQDYEGRCREHPGAQAETARPICRCKTLKDRGNL
ncbi:hypothetical protein PG997_001874 [Apiospora hydei]|uniref:Uncharacterized protein n=1 Tax=Apiospora hydei TaxID=1337664 RepID=A0ABR1X7V1_9PEZI